MKTQTLLRKIEFFWGIPIFYMEKDEKKLYNCGTFSEIEHPFISSEELVNQLVEKAEAQEIPVIYRDGGKVYFICIRSGDWFYLSGPVCVEQLTYVEIHQYYKEYHLSSGKEERHPRRMSLGKILNFVSMFYEILEEKDISVETLMYGNNMIKEKDQQEMQTEKASVKMEMENMDEIAYHHTYTEERYVMDCVREGDLKKVNELIDGLLDKAGILSKNKLNDQKYLAVTTTALATREAILGGVSPVEAYKTSDIMINQVDQCRNIEEVTELIRVSMRKFTQLVADVKKKEYTSTYTEQCKNYISKNYNHKIYLEDIAEVIGISQGHLARVFRQDTGMKVQDYILKFRVKRAANLLKYSEASLSEISAYVCFNSQSHFGSVFKQYMDMTPGEYRNKYKQKEFRS